MITRRMLLKQGAYTTLSAATVSIFSGAARAQSSSSAGFDFYISPTGSDSNSGTLDSPWAITAINTHRNEYAGKRVGLLDGTYNVYSLCQSNNSSGTLVGLAVNGGPSPASPTVIAAVNARRAMLTSANPSSGAYPSMGAPIIGQGYQQVANKGNVILDGLYLTRAWGAAIFFCPLVLPNPEGGATGIIVRNCEIYDVGGIINNNVGGIKLRFCTGALISNNTIHSVQPIPGTASAGNAAGIFSFNSHSNVYQYNTIYDCNVGIHDKNDHNGNHTYRYNYVEIAGAYPVAGLVDCSGGDAGDVVTVHNNIFVAPGTWDGTGVVMPSKQSLVFYNNTCYCRSAEGGIFYPAGGAQESPAASVKFYNNIIYSNSAVGYGGLVRYCNNSLALSDYNVYRAEGISQRIFGLAPVSAPRAIPTLYTLSAWQKTTGLDIASIAPSASLGAMFAGVASLNPNGYQLSAAAVGKNLGRVGGVAGGSVTDAGAWGGGATQIGSDFGPLPRPPVLSVN
jgi:hypothetical protein